LDSPYITPPNMSTTDKEGPRLTEPQQPSAENASVGPAADKEAAPRARPWAAQARSLLAEVGAAAKRFQAAVLSHWPGRLLAPRVRPARTANL
jgi:hypothetical protein